MKKILLSLVIGLLCCINSYGRGCGPCGPGPGFCGPGGLPPGCGPCGPGPGWGPCRPCGPGPGWGPGPCLPPPCGGPGFCAGVVGGVVGAAIVNAASGNFVVTRPGCVLPPVYTTPVVPTYSGGVVYTGGGVIQQQVVQQSAYVGTPAVVAPQPVYQQSSYSSTVVAQPYVQRQPLISAGVQVGGIGFGVSAL